MCHLDEASHHLFTGVKVSNYTVFKRTHNVDIGVLLFVHQFGRLAYAYHLFCVDVQCDYRWLVHGDFTVTGNDNRVGST